MKPKFHSQLIIWAKKGKAWAQGGLGDLYRKGNIVEKSMEKAKFIIYKLAAVQAHPRAQGRLGYIYEKGDGVPVNYDKALYYYKLAAEAYINLGYMYENDKGYTQRQLNVFFSYYYLRGWSGEGYFARIKIYIFKRRSTLGECDYNSCRNTYRISETLEDKKKLFEAICRTKRAVKVIKESDEKFTLFKKFH